MQAKQIDTQAIIERLKKDKSKAGRGLLNYVNKLQLALIKQTELTATVLNKLKRTHSELNAINGVQESVNLYGSDINSFAQQRQGFTEGVEFVLDKLKKIQ